MVLTDCLYKLVIVARRSTIGDKVMNLIYKLGIHKAFNYLDYCRDMNNPTQQMTESRLFFGGGASIKRKQHIMDILGDEQSKIVFDSVIKYRQTHDMKDRPKYNECNQYFDTEIVHLTAEEVFVDCGAFTGDTVKQFIKFSNGQFKRIVAFEPDEYNFSMLKKIKNVDVIPKATWNEETTLCFDNGKGAGSKVVQGEDDSHITEIPTIAIDQCEQCADASFIKMDIEGAEYNSLLGAKKVISQNKPKLTICIYHSDEDMFRIIELIESWNLGYKFFVRHHAQKIAETVLYCV